MACNVNTLLQDACTNGFSCLGSLRDYDVVMAELLCEIKDAIEAGGGGGGGPTQVFKGHYGGAAPGTVPLASAAIAYDLDAPYATWKWDGANWT